MMPLKQRKGRVQRFASRKARCGLQSGNVWECENGAGRAARSILLCKQ